VIDRENPYLGYWLDSDEKRLRYKGEKHLLCFGSPGSGKSTSLVVPNLLTLCRSIIVIDPKGQLAAITARARMKFGDVLILDPFTLLSEIAPALNKIWHKKQFHWNPLAQLKPNSPDFNTDARAIAQAVIDRSGDSKSEFFEASMENMWAARCMWEVRKKGVRASLRNVREEFTQPSLLQSFKEMSECDNYAIRVAGGAAYERLTDKSSQTTSLQDVIATIMKNTAFLDDNRLGGDMLDGDGIEFARLHEKITTIYVVLPVSQLLDQAKWLRMFVNLAIRAFLRGAPRVARLPRVLFMIDEFGNLGRLPEIMNVLNIARDLRLQMWFMLQNLAQLKEQNYPREWTHFFAGSGAVTTFSAEDPETAEQFSKILGKQETELTSVSSSTSFSQRKANATSGTSTSLHVFNLMEPDDLMRLGANETINWIKPGRFPFRGYAPGYWELTRELFHPRDVDPNPYFHG